MEMNNISNTSPFQKDPALMTTGASQPDSWGESDRTSLSRDALKRAFIDHLHYSVGKTLDNATNQDKFVAACLMVRDRLVRRWNENCAYYAKTNVKRAYYLSAEFLLGRALENNLVNLGIREEFERILSDMGIPLSDLFEAEADAGLGNGGLGRLAACFMDSTATIGVPAIGYGIRYKFGIFEQLIRNGYQVEKPELWLKYGSSWEFIRPERQVKVDFYGRTESYRDENGTVRFRWVGTERVVGVPYDRPIAGYGTDTVNTLRLWHARTNEELDLASFNAGDYEAAVERKNASEVISKILYPNDATSQGRELRLKQQYFFVRCSVVDIIRRHIEQGNPLETLASKAQIQLNDTHPSIAVAELMRMLIDKYRMNWERPWEITRATIAFTNHTIMSEALERWPVSLLGRVLPRHMEIIFEINRRFLRDVTLNWPGDLDRMRKLSIIEEGHEKRVRMANLAIIGSHAVNGVAALHTELLKKEVFKDFAEMYPDRFHNVTNGVTPARWIKQCNPRLSQLINLQIGDGWVRDLDQLKKLLPLANMSDFRKDILAIKRANKVALADYLRATTGIVINPDSLFDMQIKRMHEYKRQLLNILHVASLYLKIKRDPNSVRIPRTFMIGGKAASAYETAKRIIKLANSVSERIAEDPAMQGKLALYFIPNYRVSVAEKMIPACDVSEQISTAGTEASGTSNMKLALNGAMTIGTLDGANIEIREAVGAENFFLFGMNVEEVERTRAGSYNPRALYESNAELKEIIDLIDSGFFCPEEPQLFQSLTYDLKNYDPYRTLADYPSYAETHRRIEEAYLDSKRWAKMSIMNIASMGRFSSHRAIQEYAQNIWNIEPIEFKMNR